MGLLKSLGKVAKVASNAFLGTQFQTGGQAGGIDLKDLRNDAINAGFNPLTVLNATGGAAWQQQASASDFDQLSMAAAAAVQGYNDYWTNEQNRELIDAQIDLSKAQAQSIRQEMQASPFGAPLLNVSENTGNSDRSGQATTLARPGTDFPNDDNFFTADPRTSRLPVVDPGSTRPTQSRIDRGPHKGRYVVGVNGMYYMLPRGTSPQALFEETLGSAIGEGVGVLSVLQAAGTRVYVNDQGQMVETKPKRRTPGAKYRFNERKKIADGDRTPTPYHFTH